jgi:hypothetical protein
LSAANSNANQLSGPISVFLGGFFSDRRAGNVRREFVARPAREQWSEPQMKLKLAIVCLIACSGAAQAQYGVNTQRDAQGNLVHDNGGYAQRGVNQGPVNNGQIRNAPAQPPVSNANQRNGTVR